MKGGSTRSHAGPASEAVLEQAADWLARWEGGLSTDEQAEFSRWLLADPQHADAVMELDSVWRFMQKPRHTGQAAIVERAVAARVAQRDQGRAVRRRAAAWSLGTLAAAAALAMAFWPGPTAPSATSGTAVVSVEVKPERRLLADGSVVELNAGAEIAVDFTPQQRQVRLLRGEAHFSVSKDPARPFAVTAGTVSVRAVGTAFDVRLTTAEVGVLVTEGRVEVGRTAASSAHPAETLAYVDAGRRLTVPVEEPPVATPFHAVAVSSEDMRAALAWRGMRVEFTNMPLAEAVALFNRQNHVQLALDGVSLGELRISGVFWADDPEGFARLLEASAGLQARPADNGRIVLAR